MRLSGYAAFKAARDLAYELLITPNRAMFMSRPVRLGGIVMRETHVTLPELALVAGTRAALGAGLGLLLADRMPEGQRRAVGWTLFLIGAISSIPLAFDILGKLGPSAPAGRPESLDGGSRTEPADRRIRQADFART